LDNEEVEDEPEEQVIGDDEEDEGEDLMDNMAQ
jgi:hypothetical protein